MANLRILTGHFKLKQPEFSLGRRFSVILLRWQSTVSANLTQQNEFINFHFLMLIGRLYNRLISRVRFVSYDSYALQLPNTKIESVRWNPNRSLNLQIQRSQCAHTKIRSRVRLRSFHLSSSRHCSALKKSIGFATINWLAWCIKALKRSLSSGSDRAFWSTNRHQSIANQRW